MTAEPHTLSRTPLRTKGFTLIESVVAVGVSLATLGAVLVLNAQQLRLVKSARESNAASLALQDRIERMRTLTWKNLTDASYVATRFLSAPPPSAQQLAGYTERVTVSAWPNPAASNRILVEAPYGGNGTVLLSGQGLPEQKQAKVDMAITWLSKDRRLRERMFTTVISNSGVNKSSLPGFGGPSGGNWPTGTTPSSTPAPVATPGPLPIISTPGPIITTPAPTGGGGRGRGNAGGKGGKG